jgi:hypothetical protein
MASRTVVMKLTLHKTEAVYRRDAIVAKSDLREARAKLAAALRPTVARASAQLPPVAPTAMVEEPQLSRMPTACLVKPGAARADFLAPTWDSPDGASVFHLRPPAGPVEPVGHKVGHTDARRGLER